MLQIGAIRNDKEGILAALKKRNFDGTSLIEEILHLDEDRRTTQQEMDSQLAETNQLNKEIGQFFKQKKADEAKALQERTAQLKASSHDLKEKLKATEEQMITLLYQIPNTPHEKVPHGSSDEDNIALDSHGTPPELGEYALPHWELSAKYDLIDFDMGAKITGAGFPVYKGHGARLQRALINFFLDQAIESGYREVIPPHVVNEASGYGTGQLPDKDGQMYYIPADGLYMIPTAEVPITNIYRDVIVKESDFPIKNVGYTPCFRREAGSYGKDVRGLNRLHQFDKVEIVQIEHPDRSYDTLEQMINYVQGLIQKLGLPYRTLQLCGGDLGTAAAMTIDLEVYSAAQKRWLEVSSVSNFESYQANRLKCRFKNSQGKPQLVHTLNGSALALPRILASILENYQTVDGINIPEVLVPYMGIDKITA